MTTKEIWDSEQINYNEINLHKEGVFWRAYERSAYLFCKNVRPFRPSKKYIKLIDKELVSIGFPDQHWAQILSQVVIKERTEDKMRLKATVNAKTYDEFLYKFEEWKAEADLHIPKRARALAHENLPVYKAVYDLTIKIFRQSQHMQKEFRYTLGEKIKEEMIDLLTAVFSASVAEDKDKEPYIRDSRRLIEVIRVQLRLLKDLGQLAIKNMASINMDIDEISKQLTAWHAAIIKRQAATTTNEPKK